MIEAWQREWPQYDVAPREMLMRLSRIQTLIERQAKAVLAEHGLTFYGYKILAVLRRAGPDYQVTPGDLSRGLYVMSGTLTHQLDQLEEAGLVTRLPDPSDRRGVLVKLTAKGKRQIETALIANNARQQQALAPLTPEERAAAENILRKVLIHLEQGS
jgi:DNA-binding MarR family transcriptional regulator